MIPLEVDYERIGQRIRELRIRENMTQADLSTLIGCSNNYLSHIETAQTKVSLTMLLRISSALKKSPDYFLLDTPFAPASVIIDQSISDKLKQCDSVTLTAVSKMIDVLLDMQRRNEYEG